MKLDTATIVVISVLVDIVFVLILIHTWRTSTTYPGFVIWIVGTACWSLGSILAVLLPALQPQFIPKIIGNGLIMLHPLLLYEGIRQFHDIRSRWWGTPLNGVLVLIGILNQLYFFYVSENIVVRSIVIGLVMAILFLRVSLEPLMYAVARRYTMQWLLSVSLLPLVALLLVRGWVLLSGSPFSTFSAMITHDTLLRWINFYAIFGELVIAYSYLSLTSDRVEEKLKTSEQRLSLALAAEQDARNLQERFLDMISHEYRTPLAIIQTNIDIMDLKEQQAGLGSSGSLNNMQHAVDRLVDVFEATRRRKDFDLVTLDPVFETIAVEQWVRETLAAAKVFWGERFTCLNEPPRNRWLYADCRLLRTVLLNLLDNAAKYSPPNIPITLQIGVAVDQLELTIFNQPTAPLPDETEALFQKFSRGSNSPDTGGTGQGLYLARGIVEQHGGSLELTVDEHGDVVVQMRLPLAAVPEEPNAC